MALPTRKKQAKKPNSLPSEFLKTVRELFQKQFKAKLKGSEFLVYADLYVDELVFCASLTNPKSLRAASLYLSADLKKDISENPGKVTEQIKALVDVAASWFDQAFGEGEELEAIFIAMEDASGLWDAFEWEGQTIFAKLNRDNHALEHATNKFLREAGVEPEDDEVSDDELQEILDELDEELGEGGGGGAGNLH